MKPTVSVKKGRFSGIGITDKSNFEQVLPAFSLGLPLFSQPLYIFFKMSDSCPNPTAVNLELCFSRPFGSDTAVLPTEMTPGAGQAGEHVAD